jgi:hypothetical protein
LISRGFIFHGNTFYTDTPSKFFSELMRSGPGQSALENLLPDRTAFFLSIASDDFSALYNATLIDLKNNVSDDQTGQSFQSTEPPVSAVSGSKSPDNENFALQSKAKRLAELIHRETAIALYEPPSSDIRSQQFLVAGLRDQAAKNKWASVLQEHAEERGIKLDTIRHRETNIFPFLLNEYLPFLFSEFSWNFTRAWYTIYKDHVFIAPEQRLLRRIIDDLHAGNTLARSGSYIAYQEQMLTESNFRVYLNPSRLLQVPLRFIRDDKRDEYREHRSTFRNIRHAGFQLASSGNGFYTQGYLETAEDIRERTELLWSIGLETSIAAGPFVVESHVGEYPEILVQDRNNNLYLIDPSGNILWQKDLPETIIGKISQIDLYRNDRLQYLFTTENFVHLIDRNGNYVANYPIRLSASAITEAAVFDFRSDRQYRYYIGTEDNRIYGFQGDGRPLSGWNPNNIRGELVNPVKYFIYRGNTYLLGFCNTGRFYLWNMRGNDVFAPINTQTFFPNPFYLDIGPEAAKTHLFSSDTSGYIHRFNLEGDRDTLHITTRNKNHYLHYIDFTSDGERELIITRDDRLTAYKKDGTQAASFAINGLPRFPTSFFDFQGIKITGYIAPDSEQIYLHNPQGRIFNDFPLPADRPPVMKDLNLDGYPELIAGYQNRVRVYRVR